jgi:O-antigen ligase
MFGEVFAEDPTAPAVIRLTLLWLFIATLMVWSWKDWYKGLCGLIVLMAVIEHPDMPKMILGIPGLNAWNVLLMNVMLAWMSQRRKEGLRFDLPPHLRVMLLLYLGVVLVGYGRILGDTGPLERYYQAGFSYFVNEYLVNTIKWVIPGLLLFDGCRTETRFRWGLLSTLLVYLLLAVQVAKWMPPQYALDSAALEHRSLRVLINDMGYHRVNLSAMLSGASWAVLSTAVLVPRGRRWLVAVAGLFILYAQLMTAGRAGYGAWLVVGLSLSVAKWRRFLLLIPAAVALTIALAPGVIGRAEEGFTAESHDTNSRLQELQDEQPRDAAHESEVDPYTVTAGRSVAWPLVVEKIAERPLVGFGRQAMLRTGLTIYLRDTFGEAFPHPHNAYLELLLDNGIIGFAIVIPFYVLTLVYATKAFRDKESPTCSAIGGAAMAFIMSLLVSAIGSQTFYPREGWVGMWCATGLLLRVRLERRCRAEADVSAVRVTASPPRPTTLSPLRRGTPSSNAVRFGAKPRVSSPMFDRHVWERA